MTNTDEALVADIEIDGLGRQLAPRPPSRAAFSLLIGCALIWWGVMVGATSANFQSESDERRCAAQRDSYTDPSSLVGATENVQVTSFWGLPPSRDRRDAKVGVLFTSQPIGKFCGTEPDGSPTGACEYRDGVKIPLLVLPNPCASALRKEDGWLNEDTYAVMVCHELGHANGWPGDHRDGQAL